uniref:NADH:ubiquinone oxidoreductase core subunit V3 n=1 Tax=Mus spicilegus TaxID=10103 RepID=A0A8C6GZI4_MUSSI
MAVSLLLRGGRIRALKAVLLEARVFPGELVSVVTLSTESEKSAKEKELHPKTQSVLKGQLYKKSYCHSLCPTDLSHVSLDAPGTLV